MRSVASDAASAAWLCRRAASVHGGTGCRPRRRELLCNVFTPPESAAPFPDLPGGLRAGILVIHGGGWTDGEKEQLEGYAILLGRKGYVCVTNSYRMASDPAARTQANPDHFAAEESKWPAMLHDCKVCRRFSRLLSRTSCCC